MQLKKVYFEAYKSLLKKELELTEGCTGFVGINESGKSNVLNAINVLSPENKLTISDRPKMSRGTMPALCFEFITDIEEREHIKNILQDWGVNEKNVIDKIFSSEITIMYHVSLDGLTLEEKRFFTVEGLKLPQNMFVLHSDRAINEYLIRRDKVFVPLSTAVVITNQEILDNEDLAKASISLEEIEDKISTCERKLTELTSKKAIIQENNEAVQLLDNTTKENGVSPSANITHEINREQAEYSIKESIEKIQQELLTLKQEEQKFEDKLIEFNLMRIITKNEIQLDEIVKSIDEMQKDRDAAERKVAELETIPKPTEEQSKDLTTNRRRVTTIKSKLDTTQSEKERIGKLIQNLKQPLREKYSNNPAELSRWLGNTARNIFEAHLPKVVFWRYSQDYILPGETEFESMLKANSLNEISRPLVNVFRVGTENQSMTLEELKLIIKEIQQDPGERSRLQAHLNQKIKKYLKIVWTAYDQEILITLEQEQIRVEFFDPNCNDASYYNMIERSQGCQTFISFLLTVGAEAKHGVIKDTVLLLDEPETHLHPSGVRYMLQELIRAARNGNKVIFATHSIFMIDRDNFNRHIILTKKHEQTRIQPSSRERIGFFMQEEVLYSTLDINLNKDFDSTNKFNFVFEGNGDAILFENFYSKALVKEKQPFNREMTSFYHGGKCGDIKKYFTQRPIQLGSRWIFILDKDGPADDLKNLIEGKYKDFINKYVYIFQYSKDGQSEDYLELEDILPKGYIIDAIIQSVESANGTVDKKEIKRLVNSKIPFNEYFPKIESDPDKLKQLKARMKAILNDKLIESLSGIADTNSFESTFKDYYAWASAVIDKIKESNSTNK